MSDPPIGFRHPRRFRPAIRTVFLFGFALATAWTLPAFRDVAGAGEAAPREEATFAMYCYWTGEAVLGQVPGVLATDIGDLAGREVVRAQYDPRRIGLAELAGALRAHGSLDAVVVGDSDEEEAVRAVLPEVEVLVTSGPVRAVPGKHNLRARPDLFYLDLSEKQALLLNSWAYFGGDMPSLLTPEQEALRERVRERLRSAKPDVLDPRREGEGREAYRRELFAWLAGD